MATPDSPAGVKSVDVSEELLRLLRTINEKLDSGGKLVAGLGGGAVPASEESAQQQRAVTFRWYQKTLPGEGWAGRYSQYRFLVHGERWEPNFLQWRFKYESPFRTWKHEAQLIASQFHELADKFWAIPLDGRIYLALTPESLCLNRGIVEPSPLQSLAAVREFELALGQRRGCGFCVADFDPWNHRLLIYGDRERGFMPWKGDWDISWEDQTSNVIASEEHESHWVMGEDPSADFSPRSFDHLFAPLVLPNDNGLSKIIAPWRRIIFVSGLGSMPARSIYAPDGRPRCPYFAHQQPHIDGSPQNPLVGLGGYGQKLAEELVTEHLTCTKVPENGLSNPYQEPRGFHLVYFEIMDEMNSSEKTVWKKGELFDNHTAAIHASRPRSLRRSAFSAYVCSSEGGEFGALSPLYTALLLVPGSLLTRIKGGEDVTGPPLGIILRDVIRHGTKVEAELSSVVLGLSEVAHRWGLLDGYLSSLIVEDFMELKQYSELLFDDENFSLSRKYFWAIGCLGEFDVSIADNIKQWDSYYEARVKPILDKADLADLLDAAHLIKPPHTSTEDDAMMRAERVDQLKGLVAQAQTYRETLKNLRTQFKNKLETVKTLRDGLFNASALVESRESTRLGQNVKLLTYVSIFYLPLAFCAALWAIPNIQEKSTKVPFIITAILVGVITYAIVFNMDFMTNKLKGWYIPRRQNVVQQMQQDKDWWKHIGQRFEEFKPSSESKVPTKWWIPLYVALQVLTKGTWTWKKAKTKESQKKSDEEQVLPGGQASSTPAERNAKPTKAKKLLSRFFK